MKLIESKVYWNIQGAAKYPQLATVARRVFMMPLSNCASERVWSIFGWFHSKLRNRMKPETERKLAYVMVNMMLLDNVDPIVYANEVLFTENDDNPETNPDPGDECHVVE